MFVCSGWRFEVYVDVYARQISGLGRAGLKVVTNDLQSVLLCSCHGFKVS